jgi:lysophospholipase L1-like esterase
MKTTNIIMITASILIGASSINAANIIAEKHVKKLLLDSSLKRNKEVVYIVSGDSTRDNRFAGTMDYYTQQFGQINVKVVKNAASGETAEQWNNNERPAASVNNAIKNTTGNGINTIMEYSFGINDQARSASYEEQKDRYTKGIKTYLKAEPKATVILTVPVAHKNTDKSEELKRIYEEIASEMNLILVDTLVATMDIHGNPKYYFDGYHPNKWGSQRFVNYIMDQILPPELYSKVSLQEVLKKELTNTSELFKVAEAGYYSANTHNLGNEMIAKDSWRTEEFPVEPNFGLIIKYSGNGKRIFFTDKKRENCQVKRVRRIKGKDYAEVTVPQGAYFMRMNLSLNDAVYNPKEDNISVKYNTKATNFMSLDDINKGLNIRLKTNKQ